MLVQSLALILKVRRLEPVILTPEENEKMQEKVLKKKRESEKKEKSHKERFVVHFVLTAKKFYSTSQEMSFLLF